MECIGLSNLCSNFNENFNTYFSQAIGQLPYTMEVDSSQKLHVKFNPLLLAYWIFWYGLYCVTLYLFISQFQLMEGYPDISQSGMKIC